MITRKKPHEIELLKEGGAHHAVILRELAKATLPGVSTNELETLARKLLAGYGDTAAFLHYKPEGARRKYPAALCVSVNDEIVHGIPNEEPKILKEGDVVSLDLGLTHKGLITDSAITVGVGRISKDDERLINATREALSAGVAVARGGNTIGDIGAAVQAVAKRYNLNLAEGLAGHGVGYEVHEDPYVPNTGRAGTGEKLLAGMVLAIEPMLALGTGEIVLARDGYTFKTADGKNAAHFEHTVVITDQDPIVLTL